MCVNFENSEQIVLVYPLCTFQVHTKSTNLYLHGAL